MNKNPMNLESGKCYNYSLHGAMEAWREGKGEGAVTVMIVVAVGTCGRIFLRSLGCVDNRHRTVEGLPLGSRLEHCEIHKHRLLVG